MNLTRPFTNQRERRRAGPVDDGAGALGGHSAAAQRAVRRQRGEPARRPGRRGRRTQVRDVTIPAPNPDRESDFQIRFATFSGFRTIFWNGLHSVECWPK